MLTVGLRCHLTHGRIIMKLPLYANQRSNRLSHLKAFSTTFRSLRIGKMLLPLDFLGRMHTFLEASKHMKEGIFIVQDFLMVA